LIDLKRYAETQGLQVRPEDELRSAAQVQWRLKAAIARNIWGDPGFYTIALQHDPIFERAANLLVAKGEAAVR
jgi:hypothetical protein